MKYLLCILLAGCAAAPAVIADSTCPPGYQCLTDDEAVQVVTQLMTQEMKIKHLEQVLRNINLKLGCV